MLGDVMLLAYIPSVIMPIVFVQNALMRAFMLWFIMPIVSLLIMALLLTDLT